MSFKVTITDENGEVIDDLETDCLVGALHEEGSEEYQGLFYADSDAVTVLRCLRAAMQAITAHLTDEEIEKAIEEDDGVLTEEKPKGVN